MSLFLDSNTINALQSSIKNLSLFIAGRFGIDPFQVEECLCAFISNPPIKRVKKGKKFKTIMNDNICNFVLLKGKNIGKICGVQSRFNDGLCDRHRKKSNCLNL